MKKNNKTKKTAKNTRNSRSSVYKLVIKNRLSYIVIGLLFVAVIVMGIIFTLNALSDDATKNQTTSVKAAADSLKSQAINAIHNNPQLAKSLLTEARQKYQDLNDKNNMVDVDSQLYLINYISKK